MYDLHSHSLCSDGALSPQAVVLRAKDRGVTTLALTDHDTLAGYDEALEAAADCGIELVSGIEFSCLWSGMGVHVVGLNFELDSISIQKAVMAQQEVRLKRAELIAAKLSKAGVQDALTGARKFAGAGTIGRPHFAQMLIERGHVATMNMAFKRYLGAGKPGDVKQMWPSIGEAVDWIVAAGGVAVLAHPDKYKLTRTKLGRLLAEFREGGGQSMEVISGRQQTVTTRHLSQTASKYELYASCGSDFHVPGQPWQELGAFGELPEGCQPVWQLWQ